MKSIFILILKVIFVIALCLIVIGICNKISWENAQRTNTEYHKTTYNKQEIHTCILER